MTIEAAPGRAVAILSGEELLRYGIDYDEMSLADSGTRLMIGDVLAVLRHMGIIGDPSDRRSRVTIDCARGISGDCTLFFGIHTLSGGRTLRFSGAGAVFRAALAGAFAGGTALVPDGAGYLLELPADIEWWREGLLREFADDIRDDL